MRTPLRFGRYDYAAFCSFAAYACCSVAIPVSLVAIASGLGFPLDAGGMSRGGSLQLARSVTMTLALVASAFAAARWGNRRVLAASVCIMGAGIAACSLAGSFGVLLAALAFASVGEGLLEGIGTPFAQDLHAEEPSRYVNFTHGFWSLGIFCGVPVFGLLLAGGVSWRLVLALAAALAVPGALLLLLPRRRGPRYPERAAAVSARGVAAAARDIARERAFWFAFAAMLLAGGGEYCLTFWCASFVQLDFGGSPLAGGVGTASFAAGMFLGRTGFGTLVPQKRLRSALLGAGAFATAVTLLVAPFALHPETVPAGARLPALFGLLFLGGLGTAPFWPSVQSLSALSLPGCDSTTLFVLLSCAGVPGAGLFTWLMGLAGDRFGLPLSFLLVPACFALMTVLLLPVRPAPPRADAAR